MRHSVGYWVIAAAFLIVMAYSTLPTPLYALYQARDGFPTFLVTVIFAVYAVGVVVSLYLAGHVSDWVGRRPVILAAVLLEAVSAVIFLFWPEVAGLLLARFITGLGVGILTATATAHLAELRSAARPDTVDTAAGTLSGIANIGGLALGPLIGGILAQFVTTPLVVPFVIFLVLLIGAAIAVSFVPETVPAPEVRPTYHPQRVSLPGESRSLFSAAAIAAFAAFGIFGLFTSLAPTFVAGTLHVTSRFIAGVVVFSVFAAAVLAQVAAARLSARTQLTVAVASMSAGLVILAAGVLLASLPGFLIGGIVAGVGVGILFRSAVGVAASLAEPGHRGEVLAALFLVAYAGLAVPVLAIGVAVVFVSLQAVLVVFAALSLLLVLYSGIRMIARTA